MYQLVVKLIEYLVKTTRHENKNAPSEFVSDHCAITMVLRQAQNLLSSPAGPESRDSDLMITKKIISENIVMCFILWVNQFAL